MKRFRHNSARVALDMVGRSGVIEANYSGLMTAQAFDALRSEVLNASGSNHGFVLRLDRVADAIGILPPPQKSTYAAGSVPGAVIVRPDQYDKWVEYNRMVAKFGVIRSVWLQSHAALAYEWALRRSAEALQESHV